VTAYAKHTDKGIFKKVGGTDITGIEIRNDEQILSGNFLPGLRQEISFAFYGEIDHKRQIPFAASFLNSERFGEVTGLLYLEDAKYKGYLVWEALRSR
jgi:hypothetical protein